MNLRCQSLKHDTLEELAAFCKSRGYGDFMRKLIVQGLIKIEEQVVEVYTRAEDRDTLIKVVSCDKHCWICVCLSRSILFPCEFVLLQLPDALAEFKYLMAEAGRPANPKVTVGENNLPAKMWWVLCVLFFFTVI